TSSMSRLRGHGRGNRSQSPRNGDGQRPNPGLLPTMLAVSSDAVALSLIAASQRGTGVRMRRAAAAVSWSRITWLVT
ncbi:MAG TPA: hypothetical protein VFD73_22110, partial [Gemmatimonadales bacterium]|nr:hypothetical protein [Gemmatimonadales bacterium]